MRGMRVTERKMKTERKYVRLRGEMRMTEGKSGRLRGKGEKHKMRETEGKKQGRPKGKGDKQREMRETLGKNV